MYILGMAFPQASVLMYTLFGVYMSYSSWKQAQQYAKQYPKQTQDAHTKWSKYDSTIAAKSGQIGMGF